MARPKPKQHRQPRGSQVEGAEQGVTARYLRFNLTLAGLVPVDLNDSQAVYSRVMEYFQMCIDNDMKPTLTALSLALGMNRHMFARLVAGEKGKAVATVMRGAKAICEAQLQDYMHNGDVTPLQGMFELNNNYGYKNQIDVISEESLDVGEDTAKIAERYASALVDDVEEE